MDKLNKQIWRDENYLADLRRHFHANPELALQEFKTAKAIEDELDRWGISHCRVGKTGVLGKIQGERKGDKAIALRADIDALPIQEQNAVDYCSKYDGVMHACGHDAHAACLLGAAKVLQQNRNRFNGEIHLIFQPGEEIGKGAEDFLKVGVLDGVQRIFGIHTAVDLPAGTVGITPNLNNAAVDHFHIKIHGKSAHVSTPQMGSDALYIASQIVVAIQGIVTRMTSPVEPVLIGIGKLQAGTAYNAIAEFSDMEGTTRTISEDSRKRIREQINLIAQQITQLYGGTVEVIWTEFCSALINDPKVTEEVISVVKGMGEQVKVVSNRPLSLGGDNFAEFLLQIPGVYAYLGTGNPERPETMHPAHNGYFDIDEGTLPLGAALYANYAFWWLTSDI